MPPPMQGPGRSSQDRRIPVNQQNLQKPLSRRGSISEHEPRVLVKRDTGDNRDVDGERRSRNRSSSTPPETRSSRRHHDPNRPRDGQTSGLTPVSAKNSWAWGEHWANVLWGPGRAQVQLQAQVQVNGKWVVHGGQFEGRGHGEDRRGPRSGDAKHAPTPIPSPAPRRVSTPQIMEPPVLPGVTTTTTGGMDSRKLRKRPQTTTRPKILFYNKHEPYYGFTNFSPHPVTYRGKRYPTSEHLFQSLKFVHKPNLMEHIRTCDPRPSVAFAEARRFAHEIHPNWKRDRIGAMDTALYHKFTQHRDLKRELLATGDAELIENSDKDWFWGCGADGKGRNELGRALGRLRKHLREQEKR